ncbi:MAG: multiubiquitin domain-containing protein, partial [Bradyrhizobium sp.]|nr:multiubiquitin domain-containing protein [Bradyrhizobium sp.]
MSSSDHSADARHTDHGGTRHTIHIADEGFVFGPATVRDDDVTGGQVAEAAKKHPVEDYVILEHLRSGELESKRPNELTDVRSDDVHFFVIKNTGEKQDFFVDGLSMEWPRPAIEADQIVYLARAPENSEVVVHFGDGPAVIYEGSEEVRLDTPGVEKFTTRPATRTITITVDSEPFVPEARRMTPDDIISKATGQDPATTYLVFAPPGGPKESFQGKGETKIPLRDGMNFITVSTGPTTVSDAAFEKGLPLALRGLEALGYKPTVVSGTTHHVAFDYTVEAG